jgi:hypothetical protein
LRKSAARRLAIAEPNPACDAVRDFLWSLGWLARMMAAGWAETAGFRPPLLFNGTKDVDGRDISRKDALRAFARP